MGHPPPLAVGIAVILDAGAVLVTRRAPDAHLAGLDEFPGGRCQPGEATRDCAVREAREETGLAVRPLQELAVVPHRDPQRSLRLHFWECRLVGPRPALDRMAPARDPRWIDVAELAHRRFPPANRSVVAMLGRRARAQRG